MGSIVPVPTQAHFTNDFSILIQILCKTAFSVTLYHFVTKFSTYHYSTAIVAWANVHGQTFYYNLDESWMKFPLDLN